MGKRAFLFEFESGLPSGERHSSYFFVDQRGKMLTSGLMWKQVHLQAGWQGFEILSPSRDLVAVVRKSFMPSNQIYGVNPETGKRCADQPT